MGGKAPHGIITDQCMAIGNAIEKVFPNTKYRWCSWHIMRNAKKHLNFNEDRDKIRKELRHTLYDSFSIEEFEKKWEEIGAKYKLQEVNWFNEMFNLRHQWVPVFFKGDLWASMSSTQRSESMNNFFKAFVNLNTTLKDFVQQYCLALGK
ncbi:CHLOROPLAST DIVISION MUTANT 25, FAR1-related sequence 4 [Hibiscus trionum]|uniref:Protein FAR1-RELATED SEQUENCE n=1 Tax=Hibiscus trionum TaxID=183268 RepID=A0A9W7HW86_HIBTR|nr:CHLOROPLAST DIVISION MUTANT 25, FAR1-related sequence 4 [Hibiscus trionum]